MAMLTLDEKIKKCTPWMATVVETIYCESGLGQPYAILVTKVLWYCVRLIVDNGIDDCDGYCRRFTVAGVKELVEAIKIGMRSPNKTCFGNVEETFLDHSPFAPCKTIGSEQEVTSWTIEDIPSILKRGDVIMRPFKAGFRHAAVYLGNMQVAHITGDGKKDCGARITDFMGPFARSEGEPFEIVHFRFIMKPHEDIARLAEELAALNVCKGKYNLVFCNCQHFAVYCALGFSAMLE